MAIIQSMTSLFAAETERGFLWAPLCMGLGILFYFSRGIEPDVVWCAGLFAASLLCLCALALGKIPGAARGGFWALVLVALGFCVASWRTHSVAAPVLDYRYYGPVEGRVVALDRSASGALRVTLDQVRLGTKPLNETPRRVRVSLYGPEAEARPAAGARVMTTAHVSPPNGPAEPEGFDFRRHAWFQKLGGVGYTRVDLLLAAPYEQRLSFFSLRLALSDRARVALPGQTGAFAAALMTGDRSGLLPETLQALRQTNLAHLLAISGLHMGLLAGFVFAVLRLCLVAIPTLTHGVWPKKVAAAGALCVAALYLGLSGGNVATERAFIMAAVALGAIMLDRRAMSLRAVALAAIIVMTLRPEAVLGPGFQMSFAATTALVAVFQALATRVPAATARHWLRRVASGAVLSSAVAGLATLPIAAAHFNQIAHYGLIANVVSVPLMGLWIMPMAVLSVCLIPLGLDAFALKAMGWGLDWILSVAQRISDWPGAVSKIPSPPPEAFLAVCLGMILLAVSLTRARWAGGLLVVLGAIGWGSVQRPDVLIASNGTLVGVQTSAGRALSKEKGAGFVAGIWLENDGDPAEQRRAAQRWQGADSLVKSETLRGGARIFAASGKRGAAAFEACEGPDIAVFSVAAPLNDLACRVFDKDSLEQSGSVAVYFGENGAVNIKTAREVAGRRLWNTKALRRERAPLLRRFQ